MKWLFGVEVIVRDMTAQQCVTLEILISYKQLPVALITIPHCYTAPAPPVVASGILLNNASGRSGKAFSSAEINGCNFTCWQPAFTRSFSPPPAVVCGRPLGGKTSSDFYVIYVTFSKPKVVWGIYLVTSGMHKGFWVAPKMCEKKFMFAEMGHNIYIWFHESMPELRIVVCSFIRMSLLNQKRKDLHSEGWVEGCSVGRNVQPRQ